MALSVVSWNMAAVNGNPFEYWIQHPNPAYMELLQKVEAFMEAPGDADVTIGSIFTAGMFAELKALMLARGWEGVEETEAQWKTNYQHRLIIKGFMTDKELGLKRLLSMPDRFTNTIDTADGASVYRPTVINSYAGALGSVEEWWAKWKTFMFDTTLKVNRKGNVLALRPCEMLTKIKAAKYPAITAEEEHISIPLQTLCQAIFDCVLVHMMNSLAGDVWFTLKNEIMDSLIRGKDDKQCALLETVYADADVLCLQETAASLVEKAKSRALGNKYHIYSPAKQDARDQNSIILVAKEQFTAEFTEITDEVVGGLAGLSDGDLFVCVTTDQAGKKFVLASFHGDTNGLMTVPVLAALHQAYSKHADATLIFGLDANTYLTSKDEAKCKSVGSFSNAFTEYGMSSCWGLSPSWDKCLTTFNARTFLQPQLNKAIRFSDRRSKGDVNPKDFILFYTSQFTVAEVIKDNTGKKEYIEDVVFPTLDFPSDHACLAAKLTPV